MVLQVLSEKDLTVIIFHRIPLGGDFFILKWGSMKEAASFCMSITFLFDLAAGRLGNRQKLGIHYDGVNKLLHEAVLLEH